MRRPICLIDTAGKVLERAILKFKKDEWLGEWSFRSVKGFSSYRCVVDMVLDRQSRDGEFDSS